MCMPYMKKYVNRKKAVQSPGCRIPLHPASFYLCGWKVMIDEARKRIVELGYDRKAIHLECMDKLELKA